LTVVSPKSDSVTVQLFAISVARDEEALKTWALVLLFIALVPAVIAEAKLLVAVCTSDRVANDPESKAAPVRVLVPLVHTSAARVPKPVRVLVPAAQTAVAVSATRVPNDVSVRLLNDQIVAGRLDEAVSILAPMTAAREDVATVKLSSTTSLIVLVETTDQSTTKLLSTITKSPLSTVPQIITDGQIPEGAFSAVV
jgi:hypothetical protein